MQREALPLPQPRPAAAAAAEQVAAPVVQVAPPLAAPPASTSATDIFTGAGAGGGGGGGGLARGGQTGGGSPATAPLVVATTPKLPKAGAPIPANRVLDTESYRRTIMGPSSSRSLPSTWMMAVVFAVLGFYFRRPLGVRRSCEGRPIRRSSCEAGSRRGGRD